MGRREYDNSEVIFSKHALQRIEQRGSSTKEVKDTIFTGEEISAKKGRMGFRKNYSFKSEWYDKYYEFKQVLAIVKNKEDRLLS